MFKKKPFFIVFEGVEGCGKSYQSKKLRQNLKRKGVNSILTREPGQSHYFPKIKQPSGKLLSVICITRDDTISGIARLTGLKVLKTKDMTANLDTNLKEKFKVTKICLIKMNLLYCT